MRKNIWIRMLLMAATFMILSTSSVANAAATHKLQPLGGYSFTSSLDVPSYATGGGEPALGIGVGTWGKDLFAFGTFTLSVTSENVLAYAKYPAFEANALDQHQWMRPGEGTTILYDVAFKLAKSRKAGYGVSTGVQIPWGIAYNGFGALAIRGELKLWNKSGENEAVPISVTIPIRATGRVNPMGGGPIWLNGNPLVAPLSSTTGDIYANNALSNTSLQVTASCVLTGTLGNNNPPAYSDHVWSNQQFTSTWGEDQSIHTFIKASLAPGQAGGIYLSWFVTSGQMRLSCDVLYGHRGAKPQLVILRETIDVQP